MRDNSLIYTLLIISIMAKRFLYLAMVAFVATAFIACGSDDDDGGGSSGGSGKQTVTIQPAKFAQKAGKYNFTEGLKANQNNIEWTGFIRASQQGNRKEGRCRC